MTLRLTSEADVYAVADKLRALADDLDGGYEAEFDHDEVREAVLAFVKLATGEVPGDTEWNNARTRVLKALKQNV